MGTDFNIKPVGGSVAPPMVEPTPMDAKAAVQTELPTQKAVTAADKTVSIQNDSQADNDRLSRQIVIDRAAAEVVYRVVDNRTALVVRQFPDEARLRTRAYLRAQDIARQDKAHKNTDLKA
jgi:uncharacterized FlaG/YvyC family protein